MLLGNYTPLNTNPGRAIGGFTNLYSNYKPSKWYSFYDPDTDTTRLNARASLPSGTEPPYSWILAPKGGELSSTNKLGGTGTLTASAAQGINIESDLIGSGTIDTASLALVTSMTAGLVGSGTISSASMTGIISLETDLSGAGSLTASLSSIVGLNVAMTGSGTLTATLRGTLSLAADIYVNQSEATVQQIVDAVWNALAAEYNVSGTMGEKLNGAGSAGDPWTTDLAPYNTDGTAGKIVKQIKAKAAAAAALSA